MIIISINQQENRVWTSIPKKIDQFEYCYNIDCFRFLYKQGVQVHKKFIACISRINDDEQTLMI